MVAALQRINMPMTLWFGDGNCQFAFAITENDVSDSATRIHDTDPTVLLSLPQQDLCLTTREVRCGWDNGGNTDAALANNESISTNPLQLLTQIL